MNKKTVLVWYAKTPRGYRRFKVLTDEHKHIRMGWVKDGDNEVCYPEGKFQTRHYVGSKMVYTTLSHQDAVNAPIDAARLHRTRMQTTGQQLGRKTTKRLVDDYLSSCKRRGHAEAAKQAKMALYEFLAVYKLPYLSTLTATDVERFHEAMRTRGLSDRTVANRHQWLMTFFRSLDIDTKKLKLPKKPKYEKKEADTYNRAQIAGILAAAKATSPDTLYIAYSLCLKLGLREREAMFAHFSDIDWSTAQFKVQGKPSLGFKVKDNEQRRVPIPADLLATLRTLFDKKPDATLIVHTRNNKPITNLLTRLKRLAREYKLNCGTCDGCLGKHNECRQWSLHKFRRNYATTLLQSGTVDVRTVQSWLGHSKLEVTLSYLQPNDSPAVRAAVDNIQW